MLTRVLINAAVLAVALIPRVSLACGCFAPPDPTVPVVQAGERIVFAVKAGEVTAHIQIQYQGPADQFGWLLPVPSVPKLELGTEALFTALTAETQPRYEVIGSGTCPSPFIGCGGRSAARGDSAPEEDDTAVEQGSIGPYDYAVLKADSKTELFDWLAANRYFVPATSDATIAPYLRPGAYFLALKLRSGASTGAIQPIVLRYQSDVPMIPLTLTSIGAVPNMGVLVWLVGEGRGIPRNYAHVELNDARIDWVGGADNYNDAVIAAVAEAPGKHGFVTEYAGPANIMKEKVYRPGQFVDSTVLAATNSPSDLVTQLRSGGFVDPTSSRLLPGVATILLKAYPNPNHAISDDDYLDALDSYLPNDVAFDAAALTQEIMDTVVTPLVRAQELLDANRTLTRLYTTLSPEDMNEDPAFGFNPSLPEVSNVHRAIRTMVCAPTASRASLTTPQGWVLDVSATNAVLLASVPAALRVETLREEGEGSVLVDHSADIGEVFQLEAAVVGCSAVDPSLIVTGLFLLTLRRRRSR